MKDTQRRKLKGWKTYQAIIERHFLPLWAKRETKIIEGRDLIKVIGHSIG